MEKLEKFIKAEKKKFYSKNRRYKVSDKPNYDSKYDRKLFMSHILNPSNPNLRIIIQMGNKHWMQNELGIVIEKIIECQESISHITEHFENLNKRRAGQGRKLLSVMPEDLQIEVHEIEAILDIAIREYDELTEQLKQCSDEVNEIESRKILTIPLGSAKERSDGTGILKTLDGQTLDIIEGVLIITDRRSPFYGYAVQDYREHILDVWQKNTIEISAEYNSQYLEWRIQGGAGHFQFKTDKKIARVQTMGAPYAAIPEMPKSVQSILKR